VVVEIQVDLQQGLNQLEWVLQEQLILVVEVVDLITLRVDLVVLVDQVLLY
jgi:hypothetical protein|tara:strand:+ start:625 stop:777 length:153 start_codon:yes stop_codon:yes gene_type:complete